MFERFTADARQTVTGAQAEARALRDRRIGTEHVLLALAGAEDATGRALREHGLAPDDLRARIVRVDRAGGDVLDSDALRSIGIDLDAVREATEQSFGEGALDVPAGKLDRFRRGHIPFTPQAKKALELSLRHALRLGQKEIRSGHLLLGVLHDGDFPSVRLATEAGVDVEALRAEVCRLLTSKAA
ncbi:Clp protease N-terminal domain-containing protein [Actinomadura mexicana]|uniref:Clp amino terminal domain-containing protein, pathogenicity island component n=1 Tax=Actinomadura mexicana TaxID=134959 RepID=A0A238XV70_9ACTN|nr:Clp amino terminal domain-containing protein, pathogenicity island component [Actinomadura mexicana]